MLRLIGIGAVCISGISAAPVMAATEKEQDCTYQAQVVEAVRQARIARVKESLVAESVKATEPSWPEKYNGAIPLVTPWVYEMKMRDVRSQDLAGAWKEVCLSQ